MECGVRIERGGMGDLQKFKLSTQAPERVADEIARGEGGVEAGEGFLGFGRFIAEGE